MTSAVLKQKVKKRDNPFKVRFDNKDKIEILQRKRSSKRRSLLHLAGETRKKDHKRLPEPEPEEKKEIPGWLFILSGSILGVCLLILGIVSSGILNKIGIIPTGQGGFEEVIQLDRELGFEEFLYTYLVSEEIRNKLSRDTGVTDLVTNLKISSYVLKKGDTLSDVAKKYKLNLDTLVSYNNIKNVRTLTPGTTLAIPSADGVKYRVRRGDTLSGIALKHGISLNNLLDWNNIEDSLIMVGTEYFIPGGRMSKNALNRVLGRLFLFPTRGRLTSLFGWRNDPINGKRRFHNGIDLANVVGTPIKAAMDGTVLQVGFSSGYGKYVIVKHSDGFQTLYGHLSKTLVYSGKKVVQGEKIGLMGNTGYSTGSHLHFAIYENGKPVNPYNFL